jgi:hypothetical protein
VVADYQGGRHQGASSDFFVLALSDDRSAIVPVGGRARIGMWRVLRAQVYASQPPTNTKRAPERGALYAYITLGSRLPAGVLGRGDWGVGGAPGTHKSWPIVIL